MKIHKGLSADRWFQFSLMEQLSNIGADVERTMNWRNKKEIELSKQAFERVLELMDYTIRDPKNKNRAKELLLARHALVDYFVGENICRSNDKLWHDYFYAFSYIAAVERGR